MVIRFNMNTKRKDKPCITEKEIKPVGELVDVNGSKMNVYVEGNGDKTLVFMSGAGIASPILDFKSLYSLLSDKYRIVVVERFGYGFSDIVNVSRDIDTVLSNTRESLIKAGITGPYILVPHSMSGLEAVYWADKYPDEVQAIISLDMLLPELYEKIKDTKLVRAILSIESKLKLRRCIGVPFKSDAVRFGNLTEEDNKIYEYLYLKNSLNKSVIKESAAVRKNAEIVSKNMNLDVPILAFISNGSGTSLSEDEWRESESNAIKKFKNNRIINLDCPHSVHNVEYKKIAEEIKKYIMINDLFGGQEVYDELMRDIKDGESLDEEEIKYIEKVKRIGKEKGDSEELQAVCKKAYKDYREGVISSKAYNKIYSLCCEYAYPR